MNEPTSKLMNLEPHDTIIGDPESIIDIDLVKRVGELPLSGDIALSTNDQ
jgi:hypothetical protein